MWVKQFHKPSFIGGSALNHSQMGGLWHWFAHIISVIIRILLAKTDAI